MAPCTPCSEFWAYRQFDNEHDDAQQYSERQNDERYLEVDDGEHFGSLVVLRVDRLVLIEYVLGNVAVPLEHQPGLIDPRQQGVDPPFVRRISGEK